MARRFFDAGSNAVVFSIERTGLPSFDKPAAATMLGSPGSAATVLISASRAAASAAETSRAPIMAGLQSDMRKRLILHQVLEPPVRQFLLNRVLPEPRPEVLEVHAIELLILIEAREDDRLLAGR